MPESSDRLPATPPAGKPDDSSLQEQLYRYAADLQEALREKELLDQQYREMRQTLERLQQGHDVLDSMLHLTPDINALLTRLAHLVHHDSLTSLPNRQLLEDRLQRLCTQRQSSGHEFSLIFIDIDRFKRINDSHGHAVGDAVLKCIAQRLAAAVRESDTVARLGGDEFVILAPGLNGRTNIAHFCEKLIANICQPWPNELPGNLPPPGCSLGCAEFPGMAADPATLLELADAAMYRAKAAGGNRHVIADTRPAGNKDGSFAQSISRP